jgi:hypothetical protein
MQSPERQSASAEQPSPSAAGCGVPLLPLLPPLPPLPICCSVDEQAAKSPNKNKNKNELETSALWSVGLVTMVIVLPVPESLEASRYDS